jgi:putative oxidoreductase
LGLILIELGAIQKKFFVWKSGFWGEKSPGWHYELMLVSMNLLILFTNGLC